MELFAVALALVIIGYYIFGYTKFLTFKKELKKKYPGVKDIPFYGVSVLTYVGLALAAAFIAFWFERSVMNNFIAIVLIGYFLGNAIGSYSNYVIFLTNEGFYLDQVFFFYHDIETNEKPKNGKMRITLKSGHHFVISQTIGQILLRNKQLLEAKQTS